MSGRRRNRLKGRKETGTFFRIPTAVLNCPNYLGLSKKAQALLMDIGARFNGFNNGDLAAPWSWMKERGWKSKGTLSNAIRELIDAGMLELTRQGGLHGPNLYAFTWIAIHETKSRLDVSPTRVASGKWKQPRLKQTPPAALCPPLSAGKSDPLSGEEPRKAATG
ncbi:hypothetical protein [Dyella thiooxydans]|uniref:hypothetical protein n=1 Tax=Dyella thiooxydans TaxID=445710 RepID=UPI000B1FA965|nr:hypothetical protein [Dyella thiooxydans]